MTQRDVITKALERRLTWLQAADILGITPRHMLRLRRRFEKFGWQGLRDQRAGHPRRKRISLEVIDTVLELRRKLYPDFSVKHFHERLTERHGVVLSYTSTKQLLQTAGLADKAPARGQYRRKRERRPMTGMLLHLDASTHRWLPGLPMQDLVVMLDDADGRILFAKFVPQEGTLSTMEALCHVLERHGRFCELYTDRGSHFCKTSTRGQAPDDVQTGQVSRALKALGIRQILARSPQARGRSERAFGTIQGRLPQELRAAGIRRYAHAQRYLEDQFVPDFNRRFTVAPAQPESAFSTLPLTDLRLLLSAQTERIVRKDNTILFNRVVLQLAPSRTRPHFVRCPVLVHQFFDGTLGVSYQGHLLQSFAHDGAILPPIDARQPAPTGHL